MTCAVVLSVAPTLLAAQRSGSTPPVPPVPPGVNRSAFIQEDFQKRIADYMALHRKLEATLPKLPDKATPQEIDGNQRALERLLVQARAGARPGNMFTAPMQTFVKQLCARVFKGRTAVHAKDEIYDESHPVKPVINKRYPDVVPLSTMPPEVLANLPKIPEDLEYRFVNSDLILLDTHAHIILDYVLDAIPKPSGK